MDPIWPTEATIGSWWKVSQIFGYHLAKEGALGAVPHPHCEAGIGVDDDKYDGRAGEHRLIRTFLVNLAT